MTVLHEYIKEALLIEKNVLAAGECYPFAVEKARAWFRDHIDRSKPRGKRAHPDIDNKDKFKVVHGRATNKWSGESYLHAWVEMGDTIFDDQTKMTKPDGVDRETYYDHFQPEPIAEYTAEEVMVNCIKGGPGPWDEESRESMRQRDAWLHEISDLRALVRARVAAEDGDSPSPRPQRAAANAGGDCYEAAGQYMMAQCQFGDGEDCNLTLVHGEVMGQGALEGITFGHAWLLKGDLAIDKSNGRNIELPKQLYYALGGIDSIGNVHEYDWDAARDNILTYQHWGPWDLETESGL